MGLAVRLLIPDTTALTAQRALERQGLSELTDLRREVCWGFEVETPSAEDLAALAGRLGAADVLANQNTQRPRWWRGPLEAAVADFPFGAGVACWAGLLVEDRDDPMPAHMQRLLTTRLGFREVQIRRHATLWWVRTDSGPDTLEVAARAGELLLANPHGQTARVLPERPNPVGGAPHD